MSYFESAIFIDVVKQQIYAKKYYADVNKSVGNSVELLKFDFSSVILTHFCLWFCMHRIVLSNSACHLFSKNKSDLTIQKSDLELLIAI